jgi:hypothetical protein
MIEIRVSPAGRLFLLFILIASLGAAIAVQLPEIRRYLKISTM